ncbi:MAG: hypothetical protein ACHRXM_37745 [Isosphaerales bacterium]
MKRRSRPLSFLLLKRAWPFLRGVGGMSLAGYQASIDGLEYRLY